VLPDPLASSQLSPTTISPDDLATILTAFSFLEENDEHADIASGDRLINTSVRYVLRAVGPDAVARDGIGI